jgi:hypothetical protein
MTRSEVTSQGVCRRSDATERGEGKERSKKKRAVALSQILSNAVALFSRDRFTASAFERTRESCSMSTLSPTSLNSFSFPSLGSTMLYVAQSHPPSAQLGALSLPFFPSEQSQQTLVIKCASTLPSPTASTDPAPSMTAQQALPPRVSRCQTGWGA